MFLLKQKSCRRASFIPHWILDQPTSSILYRWRNISRKKRCTKPAKTVTVTFPVFGDSPLLFQAAQFAHHFR